MLRLKKLIAVAATVSAVGLAPVAVAAATLNYDAQATLTSVARDLSASGFASSGAISVQFSVNDSIADTNGSATRGTFLGALSALSFADGGNSGALSGNFSTRNEGTDRILGTANSVISAATTSSLTLFSVVLQLNDNDAVALSSDALSTPLPSLALFETRRIQLLFRSQTGATLAANYQISSLNQVSAVPLPAGLPLLLAGLGGLGIMRRIGRKKA